MASGVRPPCLRLAEAKVFDFFAGGRITFQGYCSAKTRSYRLEST